MACFRDLPYELCVAILKTLPPPQVARFELVSRYYRKLVQSSPDLRHVIDCFLLGVIEESPRREFSFMDRLETMETWRRQWKRLSWDEDHGIPDLTSHFNISGPVLAQKLWTQTLPRNDIRFHHTGSPLRGAKRANWTLQDLPDYEEFTFDWYQDLLILVTRESGHLVVHFMRCTDGAPHPDAKHPTARVPFPAALEEDTERPDPTVCGHLVALRCKLGDDVLVAEVWAFDWRQGLLLLHLGTDLIDDKEVAWRPQDCTLLDPRHLLVATGGSSPEQIAVAFDCYAASTSERQLFSAALENHALLILDLPSFVLQDEVRSDMFLHLSCQPNSPYALSAQVEDVQFRTAAPPVTLIEIWTHDRVWGDAKYDLLIPGWFLLPHLAKARAHRATSSAALRLPWQAYATHCLLEDSFYMFGGISVNGCRYATAGSIWQPSEDATNPDDAGHLIDVAVVKHFEEPKTILRDGEVDGYDDKYDHELWAVQRVVKEFVDENENLWTEPVRTAAPHLCTWTGVDVTRKRFQLVEDGFIVHNAAGTGAHAYIF